MNKQIHEAIANHLKNINQIELKAKSAENLSEISYLLEQAEDSLQIIKIAIKVLTEAHQNCVNDERRLGLAKLATSEIRDIYESAKQNERAGKWELAEKTFRAMLTI